MTTAQIQPQFSIPSLIAIVTAIASLFVGAMGGFILALIAICFGIIGVVMAMSSGVRGGIVSMFSLVLAAIGVLVAVFKAIAWLMRGA